MNKIEILYEKITRPEWTEDGFEQGWCEEDDPNRVQTYGGETLYEFEGPTIVIGRFKYIFESGKIRLVDASYFRSAIYPSVIGEDTERVLEEYKKEFINYYPKEVQEYIVFEEKSKHPYQ